MFKFKEYNYKKYDLLLLFVVILLGVIGCFLIKQVQIDGENLLKKQIIGLAGGFFIVIVISLIDYHFISKFFIPLYLLNLGLLIMVKLFGVNFNGAQRWLAFKGFQFQPSELSKVILIIFFAKLFVLLGNNLNKIYSLALSLFLMAIPTFLILTQTDLSSSMVLIFVFTMMIYVAGLSYKIIIPTILIGTPALAGIIWYVQQDYQGLLNYSQQQRVLSIITPELYPAIMWQQENSIQAIGSGGLYGKLITNAEQIRGYSYVPISESDFIFSVAGEEFGFIGSFILIMIFALLIFICLITSKQASDNLGKYISIGIASMFMFQVFVNIGVATSILPNTGLPLPFLSYGLSSLLSSMIAVGMMLNIRLQRKVGDNS
ncbi:MAG TPA: FtsW/RodA/SpoVE family cell cycle protein [Clostridiales bacterium]|nr:FtsW/RodA/SpoVE family cell cycle protein [Clostridiales bacterium]